MLIKKVKDVPAEKVQMEGTKDVSVRVLFGPKDAAPTFAMRVFELAKAGHTPYHSHPYEHEVLILKGEVAVVTEKGPINLNTSHTLMVSPNEMHQFKNLSKTNTAEILCIIPVQFQK